ncbi:hypothetical protein CORC01_10226 [Colletotrichum orchidophilum]|uniref:C2H2-type domain-containing protein n=1 Tax=Colletotrichum orchidophilum TaxID=1209926 RepID=A0A1G4AZF6_9PEZI|nr:uncharacterized protein CORC01_10226 [Colletotrichum orchidophilum]OHE94506.1 hypothetical protein CORC01_10226 [Colletotrichum orchidophilum]
MAEHPTPGVQYIVLNGKWWIAKNLSKANFGDVVIEKASPILEPGPGIRQSAVGDPKPESENQFDFEANMLQWQREASLDPNYEEGDQFHIDRDFREFYAGLAKAEEDEEEEEEEYHPSFFSGQEGEKNESVDTLDFDIHHEQQNFGFPNQGCQSKQPSEGAGNAGNYSGAGQGLHRHPSLFDDEEEEEYKPSLDPSEVRNHMLWLATNPPQNAYNVQHPDVFQCQDVLMATKGNINPEQQQQILPDPPRPQSNPPWQPVVRGSLNSHNGPQQQDRPGPSYAYTKPYGQDNLGNKINPSYINPFNNIAQPQQYIPSLAQAQQLAAPSNISQNGHQSHSQPQHQQFVENQPGANMAPSLPATGPPRGLHRERVGVYSPSIPYRPLFPGIAPVDNMGAQRPQDHWLTKLGCPRCTLRFPHGDALRNHLINFHYLDYHHLGIGHLIEWATKEAPLGIDG